MILDFYACLMLNSIINAVAKILIGIIATSFTIATGFNPWQIFI